LSTHERIWNYEESLKEELSIIRVFLEPIKERILCPVCPNPSVFTIEVHEESPDGHIMVDFGEEQLLFENIEQFDEFTKVLREWIMEAINLAKS